METYIRPEEKELSIIIPKRERQPVKRRNAVSAERIRRRKKKRMIACTVRGLAMLGCTLLLFLGLKGVIHLSKSIFQSSVIKGEVLFDTTDVAEEENEGAENPSAALMNRVIVLDAGHGGKDEGTAKGEIKEKDITLSITLKLKAELEKKGMTVILSRSDDTYLSLEERAGIANDVGADLMVSIHVDWFEDDDSIHGMTCHYMEGSSDGKECALLMAESLRSLGTESVRGTMASDFSVLRNTSMPALLVETGYLSNKNDRANLTDDEYQQRLAEAMADGIADIVAR